MLCDQCGCDVPIDELVDDIFLDMEKRAEHRREFH